ncbi:hypothetical protein PN499_06230 [Kamptonema animale CS-326]|nr:hypothetical protein [Kamptonema animale]MDB9510773.1 hypothetical protein [Kamptonema animale CS-326]
MLHNFSGVDCLLTLPVARSPESSTRRSSIQPRLKPLGCAYF